MKSKTNQKRKTVEVETLKSYANNFLAQVESPWAEYVSAEYKNGICQMLEKILWSTNNYEGYTFIYPDKVSSILDVKNPYNFTRKYL
jgi:hypothetical protein